MKSFIDSVNEKLTLKRFQVNKEGAEIKQTLREKHALPKSTNALSLNLKLSLSK